VPSTLSISPAAEEEDGSLESHVTFLAGALLYPHFIPSAICFVSPKTLLFENYEKEGAAKPLAAWLSTPPGDGKQG
jgi:hypothetical protein